MLSATDTGKFLNGKDAVLQFNDGWTDNDDDINETFTTTHTTDIGHLGPKANTGCYSFELCGYTVRIVLMFDIFHTRDNVSVTLDQKYNNVGYSSFINYYNSASLRIDADYNPSDVGTVVGGSTLYYGKLVSCGNWFVNAYAIGSITEDDNDNAIFDIVFQAFSSSPIHFEKVVEQA